MPCGEKGFQAAARAEGLGEPKKDRRFATGAGAWIGLQRKRIGKDERSPAAVAGMQSFGEGLRSRARVGGAVKERTLGRPQEGQRAAGAGVGQEIFRMPVLDIGGDTATGREEAGANPVGNFVMNKGEIGGQRLGASQEGGGRTEGMNGFPTKAGRSVAGEPENQAAPKGGGAGAGEQLDDLAAERCIAEEGAVGGLGGGVMAHGEDRDIVTRAAESDGLLQGPRVPAEMAVGDDENAGRAHEGICLDRTVALATGELRERVCATNHAQTSG